MVKCVWIRYIYGYYYMKSVVWIRSIDKLFFNLRLDEGWFACGTVLLLLEIANEGDIKYYYLMIYS